MCRNGSSFVGGAAAGASLGFLRTDGVQRTRARRLTYGKVLVDRPEAPHFSTNVSWERGSTSDGRLPILKRLPYPIEPVQSTQHEWAAFQGASDLNRIVLPIAV